MPDRRSNRTEAWDRALRWPIAVLLVVLIGVALFSTHWLPILLVLVVSLLYLGIGYLLKRD
jgi:uncharacterized membrane protein